MNATVGWGTVADGDLAGYLVYHGTTPGVYYELFVVTAPTTTKAFTGLYDWLPHYFAVTAYDTSDNESAKSTVVLKQIYLKKQTVLLGGMSCG
jgi:hypothetical protein